MILDLEPYELIELLEDHSRFELGIWGKLC